MEIKTLEHYAIMKLEEKDRRIEELEREQDKLMLKLDELTQEHQTTLQNLKKFGELFEVRSWNDGSGRSGMYVSFDCGSSISYSEELRNQFFWVVNMLGLKLPENKKPEAEINKLKEDEDES